MSITAKDLPASVLTKKQVKTFRKDYMEGKDRMSIVAEVRYDDECGNGHNSFAITADIRRNGREESFGCCHDEVAKHFPDLAPLLKWHLTSSDGPMHYIANSVYHVLEHGPKYAWVYFTGQADPLNIGKAGERLIGYKDAEDARKAEGQPGYRLVWDEKSSKVRNLDYARSSAVWPDATDEDLTAPGLEQRLIDRHPALMAEFKQAVESLGFVY